MNSKKILTIIITLICLTFLVNPLLSQTRRFSRGKARLKGVVTDEAGNPLAKVKIVATFEDQVTTFEDKTNKSGEWTLIGLGTGQFKIEATMDGYLPEQTMVNVNQLSRNPIVTMKLKKPEKAFVQEDLRHFYDDGMSLLKEKKYDDAIKSFQMLLEKKPDLYQIQFKVGDCYHEKGDTAKAIEIYEKAILAAKEKNDTAVVAQALGTMGGMYLKENNLEKAQAVFKQSIEMNPKDEILAYNVGEITFNSGKTDESITYYEMATTIKPTWSAPYEKLGYAYLNKGDIPKAIECFNKFIELEPEDSQKSAIVKEVIQSLQQ